MKWVHADVNGAIVVLALLYGKGDFTQTLGIATMSGYDSDCNVGTVGAILGAALGETGIPDNWKQPMHDIYHTNLKLDNRDLVISEIAKETAEYGLKVMSEITS
jgi:ADP-ribosylglycohydrolase